MICRLMLPAAHLYELLSALFVSLYMCSFLFLEHVQCYFNAITSSDFSFVHCLGIHHSSLLAYVFVLPDVS